MKLCICFGIYPFSNRLRLTFFSFLKPWADLGSANQYSCQLLYGVGWWRGGGVGLMTPTVPFYLKNAYCGRSAWWNSLSLVSLHLISSSLIQNALLKTNKLAPSVPFWCLRQKLSLSLLYFNKTWLHKKLWGVNPLMEILSSRGHKSQHSTWLAMATFQNRIEKQFIWKN